MLTEEQNHIQGMVFGYKAAGPKFLADRLLRTIFSDLEDDGAVAVHNVFASELRSMLDPNEFDSILEEIAGVIIERARIFREPERDNTS